MWEYRSYSELYHHGILGQKWGRRNGPPYPIPSGDHSALEKRKAAEARAKAKAKEKKREEKQAARIQKAEEKAKKKEESRVFTARQKKIIALGALAVTGAIALHRHKNKSDMRDYYKELDRFKRANNIDDLDEEGLKNKIKIFEMRKKIIDLGFGEGASVVAKGKNKAEGILKEGIGKDIVNDVVKKVATSTLSGAALYGAKAFASKEFKVKDFGEALFNGGPKKK